MYFKIIFISFTVVMFYLFWNNSDIKAGCLIHMFPEGSKIFREPTDCDMCRDVHQVDRVQNMTPWGFYEKYYLKQRPVIVTDATDYWNETEIFTFDFFKRIYLSKEEIMEKQFNCQFFPYKTEFNSLSEVLQMDENRSKLTPGTKPWYVGWSNCNYEVGKELRKYYNTPYFIPPTSESIALTWTFMGGPGYGAQMHVDNVHYPSWQVQLKGRKRWRLAPPPECFFVCKELEVIIHPKETIVVDTNRWYHQTTVLPGEISITIGAEFD